MFDKKSFFRKEIFLTKEKKRKLVKDERAVSPVIAEILMVAIVVILAAVIAAFVFGIGLPTTKASPEYALNRVDGTTVSITLHNYGGASVIKALHNVTGDVTAGTDDTATLGADATADATVGATDTFTVTSTRAHIVVTANIDGSDRVVVDTTI